MAFAGLELRSVVLDDQPWFVATDVCRMIGLAAGSTAQHLQNVGSSHLQPYRIPGTKGRAHTVISEAGLYTLVMRAQRSKPQALKFQNWVTHDVLPAIRQDGMYVKGEEKLDLNDDLDLAP